MDEMKWARARDLATAYAEAYSEPVAEVLGEALLDALAELLVPKEDREEVNEVTHQAFLEGVEAYRSAPVGTEVGMCDAYVGITRRPEGWVYSHDGNPYRGEPYGRRPVIRWGQG